MFWAYRTTAKTTTGKTIFSLADEMEVVLPIELDLPMSRVAHFHDERNEELMRLKLDLLEEIRADSQLRNVAINVEW